ncbi:hypothetical protein LOTGIDRAFT_121549 [Lottia gigantea]|uniref:Proliferation-associated SNF2-like protein n=1 Tax=Lottia gigantea TaxID=225164 RepID=V4A5P2_LOTGI|nr:hypothetical protein LOTGIDRAFT_121549 [Lottia gigantea]ESO92017.1 hypothetical protein LOTGIDRAFT_121549 [Lottia gigantea]
MVSNPEPEDQIILTSAMMAEEARLEDEGEKKEREIMEKHEQEMTQDEQAEKYRKLQYLLTKSNMYTEYLIDRMKQQKESKKAREEKRLKRLGNKKAQEEKQKDEKKQKGKKSRLEEMTEIAAESSPLSSPKSVKSQVLSQSSQKNIKSSSQTLDTPKSSSSVKLRNSPRISNAQADDKEDEKRIINGEEVLDNQPVLFTGGVLRQYQIDGFNWLEMLYENGINGILADEMGLGKTVQCVAIIGHLVNMGIVGPFLVVGPLSTLPNWFSEFKRFTPKVPVILYHGTKEERAGMRSKIRKKVIIREGVAVRPVVITSYEISMIDKGFMSKQEWKYLIVDEGHRIKNSQCRLIKELRTYDSTHRLLLTGTPLQNNLAELWSLLNFLLPEIFDDLGSFESWFDIQNISDDAANEKIIAEEKENNILSMLHQILRPFMLRRLKTDVDLLIPPKKEILVYAPMTAEQQEMYRYTVDKTILQKIEEKNKEVIEYNEAGRPKRKSAGKVNYGLMLENQIESDLLDGNKSRKQAKAEENDEEELEAWAKKSQVTVRLQNIMMQLRKCCNHPYLLEHPIDQETGDLKLDECIINKSGKMMVLDKMLAELKKRGHKVLVFSQMTKMMDLLEDFCMIRDYNYCRLDGNSKMQERKEQMESFNDPDGDMFVFLLSTRAGGLGINLTGADTCIIYDSDWNPQCDLQAQDRCHRIGQTRPVVVYRFITVNTIDQKIVERAAAKRKLEKMVIHKGKFKKGITEESTVEMKPMSAEELLSLLESKDHCSIMSGNEGSSIDQEDLEKLLDRSDLYEKWQQQREAAEGQ